MLKGYSGFNLQVKTKHNQLVFIKSTQNNPDRLKRQCEKQKLAYDRINKTLARHYINVPRVLHETEKKGYYAFEMELIDGRNILDVLEKDSYKKIEYIADVITQMINTNLHKSEEKPLDVLPFLKKLEWIDDTTNFKYRNITDKVRHQICKIGKQKTFYGPCHGDFTLSNMIFSDKLYLIDWHDPFSESPLQDIGKLYQEMELKWSLRMDDSIRDTTKVELGYGYLKKLVYAKIERMIVRHKLNKNVVNLFKLMTIVRLLAYTKNKEMEKLIIEKIGELV
jgi:thiamine kinase-like enzyme